MEEGLQSSCFSATVVRQIIRRAVSTGCFYGAVEEIQCGGPYISDLPKVFILNKGRGEIFLMVTVAKQVPTLSP